MPRPGAGRGTGAALAGSGHPRNREVDEVAKDEQQIIEEFDGAVNMTGKELEGWLQTDESQSVGQSDGGGESKGHESGRKIVEILEKNKSDYTDDVEHMQRVVSY